ncbi:coiled-coil domain-containing protein 96 isoform X1 [Betta splendens]|uniref:Coiled-coil domain-containing protein 96 isoform X1 n=1 Tax=Betta splendens TaxID=158456 RepID=A0A6P7LF88_BETSP|nr:coiled-coil domain-containing protein 96 isoform X1 [Betta splendens]
MDAEVEHIENDVENDIRTPTVLPNEVENPSITVSGNDEEDVPAEVGSSDQEGNAELPEELPREKDGDIELHGVSSTTRENIEVKVSEVNEQPHTREEAVDSEISSGEDRGPHRPETPQTKTTTPALVVEEASGADPADGDHIGHGDYTRLHQELWDERGRALQRSIRLQATLTEYLRRSAEEAARPEKVQEAEPLQEYETCMSVLTALRRRLDTELDTVPRQAELLRSEAQEQLAKVENEWRALTELKRDVAVAALSRSLGKHGAQEKAAAALAAEQLRQDRLIKARTGLILLRARTDRLEAELREADQRDRDPLRLWFTELQAARLKQKRHVEKQSEESLKLQKKISSDLELLSNVKEKLYWSQAEVQAKRQQLADVEAAVATKRDLLTRTKQARDSLHRDNQRLKEGRGLLGNRVLLQDFEDAVDAVDHLEEQLQNLKSRRAEIVFSGGRSKNPETN